MKVSLKDVDAQTMSTVTPDRSSFIHLTSCTWICLRISILWNINQNKDQYLTVVTIGGRGVNIYIYLLIGLLDKVYFGRLQDRQSEQGNKHNCYGNGRHHTRRYPKLHQHRVESVVIITFILTLSSLLTRYDPNVLRQ